MEKVSHLKMINYNVFFNKVGLHIGEGKVETNYLQNNGTNIVTGDPSTMSIVFTDGVTNNSFWHEKTTQSYTKGQSLSEQPNATKEQKELKMSWIKG